MHTKFLLLKWEISSWNFYSCFYFWDKYPSLEEFPVQPIMECIYSPFITLYSLCVHSFLSSVVLAAVRNKHRRCTQLSYKSASSKRRYSEFELLSNDSRVSLSIQKVDLFSYIHKGSYTNDPTKSDRREAPLWYAKHSARSNAVC